MNIYSNSAGFILPVSSKTGEESVQQINFLSSSSKFSEYGGRYNAKIRNSIELASAVYNTDGILKQSVDTAAEMIRFSRFESNNARAVTYLTGRLKMMALQTGEPWKITFNRIICEYFKTGNVFLLKQRGYNERATPRILYSNRPYSLSGIKIAPVPSFSPIIENHVFYGWRAYYTNPEMLLSPGAFQGKGHLINLIELEDKENIMLPGADLAHIYYKKPADAEYGIGMTLAGIEDVTLLRSLELTVAVMLKKFSAPLYHHIVKAQPMGQGTSKQMQEAQRIHARNSPDGVIITNDHHEIKSVGSENSAIRAEGYLDFFAKRAAVGVGTNSSFLGIDNGGIGAIDNAVASMKRRAKFCMGELNEFFSSVLLDEILWEGGFDPYTKEEDKIKIIFEEVDFDEVIKKEAHAADMFTKNAIDHNEFQHRVPPKKAADEGKLHSNIVAKGEKKYNPKIPKSKEDLTDFFYDFSSNYSISEEFKQTVESLLDDQEALETYVETYRKSR